MQVALRLSFFIFVRMLHYAAGKMSGNFRICFLYHQLFFRRERARSWIPSSFVGLLSISAIDLRHLFTLGLLGQFLLLDFQYATQAQFFLPLASLCEMSPPPLLSGTLDCR